jgi:hypothetical protein
MLFHRVFWLSIESIFFNFCVLFLCVVERYKASFTLILTKVSTHPNCLSSPKEAAFYTYTSSSSKQQKKTQKNIYTITHDLSQKTCHTRQKKFLILNHERGLRVRSLQIEDFRIFWKVWYERDIGSV